MSHTVFADGDAISAKAGGGKVIAAFPDVCLSPPSPPAGPIPIPYPVSSFSSDATNGSKSVKINGKEIMLKNKSYFSKCTGDEAATKTLGMGVVSHNITGKVYFVAWSMDVKIEGLNVDRHLDLMTSNHASPIENVLPIPEMQNATLSKPENPCTCDYSRDKCSETPTNDQDKYVNGKGEGGMKNPKCWKCKSAQGEFIADHQPSLNERWFRGGSRNGCNNPDKFCSNATSTPGQPKGNKQYTKLLARCKGCYADTYKAHGVKSPSGKIVNEGGMESGKAAGFRSQYKAWGLELKPSDHPDC